MRAFPPCAPIPLKKGGWHSLLSRGVDLRGGLLGADGGGVFFRLGVIWAEDCSITAVEGVRLRPCKVVAVGHQRRHKYWMASKF